MRLWLLLLFSFATPVLAATAERPSFAGTTLDGKAFSIEGHRGQWLVVNFWATWCGPCIKEMPILDELDRERADVTVVGLAFEDTPVEELRSFVSERAVSYPIVQVDVYAPPADFEVPKGLPLTHLIDPEGKLRQSFLGPITKADLERAISAAKAP